jgi:hypothetical protein
MKKAKLTPWFPGTTRPAREGVYQRIDGEAYALWDGRYWRCFTNHPATAVHQQKISHVQLDDWRWRGLASPPDSLGSQS